MSESFYGLVKRVQAELPEGYEITIRIEGAKWWVELKTPKITTNYYDTLENSIRQALKDALEEAKEPQ